MFEWRRRYWMYVRPDAVEALHNETFRKVLSWYYEVMEDRKPAKFIIAKSVPVEENFENMDLEAMWSLHDEVAKNFMSLWNEVRKEDIDYKTFVAKYRTVEKNFLELKIAIAKKILRSCRFCEWRCGVDRAAGMKGFCRLDAKTYVHSWFLHIGEEAPLVPSGTIFYGSCNFRCVYCQNWDISQEHIYEGVQVDAKQLALLQKELRMEGARNINHVGGDPTPNIHTILESLRYLDINTPQLWNSNFYMTEEAMKLLIHVIDIWLPDFKYGNNECAQRLSKVRNYLEVVTRNLSIAVNYGDMIIRHLVLPNHIECCSFKVLEWIANNLPRDRVLVNIMDQYRPEYKAYQYKDIARRPRHEELEKVYEYADRLGILWRDISR